MTRYMRWLKPSAARLRRRLSRAVALVGRRARGFLGLDLGLLRGPGVDAAAGSSQAARCPGRVVPGARLNYAETCSPASPTTAWRSSTPPSSGSSTRSRGASCASRSPARPRRSAGSALRPATGSSPIAEHSRDARRLPRHRFDRRDLVQLFARLRARQRHRPVRPDRAQGARLRRRLPLQRSRLRPPRRGRRPAGGDAVGRPHGRPPYLDPTRTSRRFGTRSPGTSCSPPASRARSTSSRSPSTIRSGSCTRPGPPACRRSSSHGGILVEQLKKLGLHLDAGGRPGLLVHDHRLDDVELPRSASCSPTRRSSSTTAAPATRTRACSGTSPRTPG